jgi:sulfate transport system substrate-binding protein
MSHSRSFTSFTTLVSFTALFVGAAVMHPARASAQGAPVQLLNVSYDPTRELYEAYNKAFANYWKKKTGQDVTIRQSHGGSGKQARSVIDGLEADVVTLGLESDIDAISKAGLINSGWVNKLPHHSTPYTSTIVFLVRKGNPKHIKDWNDLIRPGVRVITPNPKTSSGARWAFLGAYGYALDHNHGSDAAARNFLKQLYKNVPVLDAGARGSTTTFLERGIGDVLLSWENEALLAINKLGASQYEIVVPPTSILAEPPVAVVDRVVDKRGTRTVATAYLEYLESPEGQTIVAQNYYRPHDPKVAAKFASEFKPLKLYGVDRFGAPDDVEKKYFGDDGVFDQIYQPNE